MQQKPSIWLIDDEPSVIEVIRLAFEKEQLSCQFEGFSDVDALSTAIQQTQTLPALLLVDQVLPYTSGLQLIESLIDNPETRSLKIVLISQHMTREVVEKAADLQVYQIANKPFSFEDWRTFARELCLAGHFP